MTIHKRKLLLIAIIISQDLTGPLANPDLMTLQLLLICLGQYEMPAKESTDLVAE